jgi:hypothetical protein
VQAAPLGFVPQVLLVPQVWGDWQSLSEAHVPLHRPKVVEVVVVSHFEGKQLAAAGVVHLPLPSHVDAAVDDRPSAVQTAAPQFLPLSQSAHAPDLQSPVVPQVVCLVTGQTPCGSGVPSATAVHVPADVARLQVMQAPVQEVLQQTPWAQKFDRQSVAVLQMAPLGFLPHEELWQILFSCVLHCPLSVQVW